MNSIKIPRDLELQGPEGIGGWLSLFLFRCIMTLVMYAVTFENMLADFLFAITLPGLFPALVMASTVIITISILFDMLTIIHIFMKKRRAIVLYCITSGLALVYHLVTEIIYLEMGRSDYTRMLVIMIIVEAIVINYLFRSKRVKNTLVR